MSGNGIGCLVQAALPRPAGEAAARSPVRTDAGLRQVDLRGPSPTASPPSSMGAVTAGDDEPEWTDGSTSSGRRGSTSATPTSSSRPPTPTASPTRWMRRPRPAANAAVAGGINVEVVTPGDGDEPLHGRLRAGRRSHLRLRHRAPCASAVAAHHWGLAGDAPDRPHDRRARCVVDLDAASSRPWPRPSPTSAGSRSDRSLSTPVSLIERAFREKIVLVGVALRHRSRPTPPRQSLDELGPARRHRRRRRRRPRRAAPRPPDPTYVHRQGARS